MVKVKSMEATSLDDIADHFEDMAEKVAHQADISKSGKTIDGWNREAQVWMAAANTLRITKLVEKVS